MNLREHMKAMMRRARLYREGYVLFRLEARDAKDVSDYRYFQACAKDLFRRYVNASQLRIG